jgi:EAL domain-containing protein (putative c-di-GMP-specific phosphodiesterase class I)
VTALRERERVWDDRIAEAITGRGVQAHFQPIVDLQRLQVTGYEALARFAGPAGGAPSDWFAQARQRGAAAALDAAVLRVSLGRRGDLPTNCFLAVNVEPDSLCCPLVDRAFSDAGDLTAVVIELTEHTPVEDYAPLLPVLERHRAAGASIAIDDAGAGYAGLQHLLRVRPDFLKLDASIVSGVGTDEAKAALVELVGTLASRLDTWVVAEGVEHVGDALRLRALGVPLVQGNLFAPARPRWARLDPALRRVLDELPPPQHGATVRSILELAPTARHAPPPGGATGDFTVLLDEGRRPTGCVTTTTAPAATTGVQAFRTSLDTPIAELATRLLTRPEGERFQPVVVCDGLGRYVGVVRVERVLSALSRLAASRP